MKLLSIQVGQPQTLGHADAADPMERAWTSGFYKATVQGPIAASSTGLAGDGQADLKNHGGPDKAINAYPADHFDYWQTAIGLNRSPGGFGENFTTQGAVEIDVSIGDTFRVGHLVVQISQPRQPCWKLARRWRIKELAALVEQTGRTGWYFRVLEVGKVEAPAEFVLLHRPHPEWTIAKANAVMHHRKTDWAAAQALAECAALSQSWKTALLSRVAERHLPPPLSA